MKKYLALTGGVGGAKLCVGLARCLPPEALAFVVNTGDDFEHLGLHIAPDLDSLSYALAGLDNPDTGWGRAGETWQFLETLATLGGETWFRLGDRDLALHVARTTRLRAGAGLSEITRDITRALGVRHAVLPMSDDPVRTEVHTAHGTLAFQHYFVRERCAPPVTGFSFAGADKARLTPDLAAWLADPALAGIIVCPSNPFVSIDPILAVPALRAALVARRVPLVAVSPIVAGLALKGPTAKMMQELAVPQTAAGVAAHYGSLLDGFVLDRADAALVEAVAARGPAAIAVPTIMVTLDDRIALARATLEFIATLNTR